VVSWPGTGVACCRNYKCNKAHGWVENPFPLVGWFGKHLLHMSICYTLYGYMLAHDCKSYYAWVISEIAWFLSKSERGEMNT
jgi:hypothetical protein